MAIEAQDSTRQLVPWSVPAPLSISPLALHLICCLLPQDQITLLSHLLSIPPPLLAQVPHNHNILSCQQSIHPIQSSTPSFYPSDLAKDSGNDLRSSNGDSNIDSEADNQVDPTGTCKANFLQLAQSLSVS